MRFFFSHFIWVHEICSQTTFCNGMEKAGEGFPGMDTCEGVGQGLGDGVLGLIWSGFLLPDHGTYCISVCVHFSPFFALHCSGFVSFGRGGLSGVCIFLCLFCVVHFWFLLCFTMALRLCIARIGETRKLRTGFMYYHDTFLAMKGYITSYIPCILRLHSGRNILTTVGNFGVIGLPKGSVFVHCLAPVRAMCKVGPGVQKKMCSCWRSLHRANHK